MMTEPWKPETPSSKSLSPAPGSTTGGSAGYTPHGYDLPPPSPSDFPLPPSLTSSPTKSEMHYTPLRGYSDSPSRGVPSFITPPKTIWDEAQDQGTAGNREQNIPSSPPIPTLGFLQDLSQNSTPPSAKEANVAPIPSTARFSFSPIITQETIPIEPPTFEVPVPMETSFPSMDQRLDTAQNTAGGMGLLGTKGAALGLSRTKQPDTVIAEDETSQAQHELAPAESRDQSLPFKDISGNAGATRNRSLEKTFDQPVSIPMSNQGSQTMLTAEQIDNALNKSTTQASRDTDVTKPPALRPIITDVVPRSSSRNRGPIVDSDLPSPLSPVKHPGSSNSQQAPITAQHPPLPSDHRKVIAKAGERLSLSRADSYQAGNTNSTGLMGPPVAPASAYRRPRTSADQSISSPTRGGATPRPTPRDRDRTRTGSQMSRRSSVSSFASELDQRFNIRTDGLPANQCFEAGPSTDPRMIQAITQTMIGEFLWKYTRKPGRPEMSNTRHLRYFWVHPYTRTLYWSEQDPQAAGGRELKAKSVAIESVRVVTDDNPMPPGLHRKSLEVVTPGRKVKFTAGTANRHETWFNALSYLLMRGQDDGVGNGAAGAMEGALTADDVDEFNPGGYGRSSRMNASSRMSLSSYNSQTTRGTNHARASLRQGLPSGTLATGHASSSASGNPVGTSSATNTEPDDPNRTIRQGSVSRFSNMFKPASIRDSFSMSRRSVRNSDMGGTVASTSSRQGGPGGSIYNASVVSEGGSDSAEEFRREMLRQERSGEGKLENVRACCDGKSLFYSMLPWP
jgi:Meiotic cell cortex C-terminal pleckstrin homology